MDITGASGAIPRDDWDRMDDHAERYYEEIRKRTSDIAAISKNTGFTIEDVESIKKHIFFNKYHLDKDEPQTFDPSYDMAVSWQRLIDGKDILDMDIAMLNHELLEHKIMSEGNTPYRIAHEQANEMYNYQAFCDELDGKAGLR